MKVDTPIRPHDRDHAIREKSLFILTSAILVQALRNNKTAVMALLRKGGPIAKRRVLETIGRLKNWIEDN
jgi:hypothetical protein